MFSTRKTSSVGAVGRTGLTLAAALALAAGVGCARRAEQPEEAAQTLEIDRAMQLRDWDRSTASYSSGEIIGEPTRFPLTAPATDIPYGAGVLEPLAFFANVAYFPFSYIFTPPGSDRTFGGVETEPTYTATPALPPDDARFEGPTVDQGLPPDAESGTTDTGADPDGDPGAEIGPDEDNGADETGTPPADTPGRTLPEAQTTPEDTATIPPDADTPDDGAPLDTDLPDSDPSSVPPDEGADMPDDGETELEPADDAPEGAEVLPDPADDDDATIADEQDAIEEADDTGIDAANK